MSVYFAQAGPYTKVGYSTNPFARSETITRSGTRPDDLPFAADARLIGWIPGDTQREMSMLVRFADRRVAGEWFVIEEAEVRELIWADPAGVDIKRMSGLAVICAHKHPGMTREEIAAVGIA